MSTISASVIIPTKNKLTRLRLVLQGLEPQMNDSVEVILVLDGCNKQTITGIKNLNLNFSPKLLINQKTLGRSAARNRGIQEAKGHIIIFLDDDRIPGPGFISKHLAGHESHNVVIGERRQLYFSEDVIKEIYEKKILNHDFSFIVQNSKPEFADNLRGLFFFHSSHPFRWLLFVTGNVSLKKSDLETVGLFDQNYKGWGYEDTDLGYRLAKVGLKFVKDSSIINYHLSHETDKIQKSREELKNLRYFADKFKNDRVLQNLLLLMKLKAKLTPYL